MAFGCDHGDGWYGILEALCARLEEILREETHDPDSSFNPSDFKIL